MVGQALPPAGAKRWQAGALALQIHSNAAFLRSAASMDRPNAQPLGDFIRPAEKLDVRRT
jgi:hypothetical protein